MSLKNKSRSEFSSGPTRSAKPARAKSLRAASARDTFLLGNEINRAAFHFRIHDTGRFVGRIDVKQAFSVLMKPQNPSHFPRRISPTESRYFLFRFLDFGKLGPRLAFGGLEKSWFPKSGVDWEPFLQRTFCFLNVLIVTLCCDFLKFPSVFLWILRAEKALARSQLLPSCREVFVSHPVANRPFANLEVFAQRIDVDQVRFVSH